MTKTAIFIFFHDTAHAYKNLNTGLLRNEFFILSKETVVKYDLPTDKVNISHLYKLCSAQENLGFSLTLAPKLQEKLLDPSNHFQKMKVNNATNVLSHVIGSALQIYAKDIDDPSLITTGL